MTFLPTQKLQSTTKHVAHALFGWRARIYTWPAVLRWAVVLGVALVLGMLALFISQLSPRNAILLLLVVLCPFVAMVVGNLRRLMLGAMLIDIPLQIDVNFSYQEGPAELGAIGAWNISITTIALVVLYLLWVGSLLTKAGPHPRPVSWLVLPFLVYIGCGFLSLVAARDVMLGLFSIFLQLQMFLVYLYIASSAQTKQNILFIVTMLLVGLILESVIMIALKFTGLNPILAILVPIDTSREFAGRIGGTFGVPNAAASYLSLTMAIAGSVLLTQLERRYKWLAMLAFGLGAVALILTISRGGWLALALAMVILCALAWRRGWLPLSIPFTAILIIIPFVFFFQDAIVTRLTAGENGRSPLLRMAFAIIQDHPLLGVGANNFAVVIKNYATPEFGGAWLYIVHNTYLLIWAEVGIIGLVAIIWILLSVIRQGWRAWQSSDRLLASIALGCTSATIAYMVHMQFDVFNGRISWQLIWVMAGIIGAIITQSQSRKERTV